MTHPSGPSNSPASVSAKTIRVICNAMSLCKVLMESIILIWGKIRYSETDSATFLGALHVEVMKMLSVSAPTLLYLDAVLFCATSASCSCEAEKLMWPSELMSMAVQFYFIDKHALGRVLIGSGKPAQLAYQEAWRSYGWIKEILPPLLLFYVHRFAAPYPFFVDNDDRNDAIFPVGDIEALFGGEFVDQLLKAFTQTV